MTTIAAERRTVTVNLERACHDAGCEALADRFHAQLGITKYSRGASVMAMPASLGDWRAEHRTARKRADRCARLGYRFDEIDRSQFNDDLHEINTSKRERQGRPMSAGYLTRHNYGPLPDYPCDRHRVHTYGVLQRDRLRAYLTLYRVGELGLVSMILGHGDHEDAGIMYLLIQGVIADQIRHGGFLYYNRHDSGGPGLTWKKESYGFHATDIKWVLG